ncbi:TadE/TadG family type IV pilus assembly protein [uncultured Roseobacter sp.]|uniref:TadE/TadG family type IV pilus assembly protein n=1 Tax=uncultured Roseobacter sp. TaxID=114847 RepID=UPI00263588BB|nr:TadE/TadG family type IV pilus assembly protein [uncultured Roseobacter sp.]
MLRACTETKELNRQATVGRISAFRKEEEGTVTIFATFMIIMMLMVCGIAVDLMQNEMMRTRVQNTLDRAILAASDLDQPLPPDEVVDDYFAKAGMTEFLDDVQITPGAHLPATNYRIVAATARTRTPAIYMAMTGTDSLPVYTTGMAEEVIEKTEISLVLDISGSMRFDDRIGKLRVAANEFLAAVLDGQAGTTTSINVIPYAGQTNPGPIVFNRAGGVQFADTITVNGEEQPYGGDVTNEYTDDNGDTVTETSYVSYNDRSACLELDSSDFNNIDLPSGGYDQTPHFMNWAIDAPTMDWGWCPLNNTAIQYAQNNLGNLQAFINTMRLHDGTGTHYGMKYAAALLNPTSNSTFRALETANLVPPQFADRPAPFTDTDTRKFIVLMTDGKITSQLRPKDPNHELNPTKHLGARSSDRETISSGSTNINRFYSMCDKAKAQGIVIYTIAFEAPSAAVTQMRNCATTPAFSYNVQGVEIATAFKSIARQINELRLTQ